jgi:general stress protein 26
MGDIKNLYDEAAVEKLNDLVEDKICMFCTYEGEEISSRPMGTQGVDEDGTIWFFSARNSLKNIQVERESKVYLMYADPGKHSYLTLKGNARVVNNREKIKELWNPIAKAWFEEGEDDPDITLIRVTPNEGHYWNTKNGKLVSMLQIAAAALTGSKMDGGVEGDIKI